MSDCLRLEIAVRELLSWDCKVRRREEEVVRDDSWFWWVLRKLVSYVL